MNLFQLSRNDKLKSNICKEIYVNQRGKPGRGTYVCFIVGICLHTNPWFLVRMGNTLQSFFLQWYLTRVQDSQEYL